MTPPVHFGIDISRWNPVADPVAVYTNLKTIGGGAEPFYSINSETPEILSLHDAFRAAGFRANAVYRYVTDPADTPIADQMIQAALAIGRDPIPVCMDYELQYGRSWSQIADDIAAAFQIVRAFRRSWAAYLEGWWVDSLETFPRPLWLPDPGAAFPSHDCMVWQRSFTANVPGIEGQVDLDQWMGTEVAFARFFTGVYD